MKVCSRNAGEDEITATNDPRAKVSSFLFRYTPVCHCRRSPFPEKSEGLGGRSCRDGNRRGCPRPRRCRVRKREVRWSECGLSDGPQLPIATTTSACFQLLAIPIAHSIYELALDSALVSFGIAATISKLPTMNSSATTYPILPSRRDRL